MEKNNKKITVNFIKPCEIREGNELTSVTIYDSTEISIAPSGILTVSNSNGIRAGFREWTSFEVKPSDL